MKFNHRAHAHNFCVLFSKCMSLEQKESHFSLHFATFLTSLRCLKKESYCKTIKKTEISASLSYILYTFFGSNVLLWMDCQRQSETKNVESLLTSLLTSNMSQTKSYPSKDSYLDDNLTLLSLCCLHHNDIEQEHFSKL